MIWLLALLPLSMAYIYRPGMWHTCAWGQLAADPRPPVFALLAAMYLISLLWAAIDAADRRPEHDFDMRNP